MLSIELSKPYPKHIPHSGRCKKKPGKEKNNDLVRQGESKWRPPFSQGKNPKKVHAVSQGKKPRWESCEPLMLVSSTQHIQLVDLVFFLSLGPLFRGLGLKWSGPSASCQSPDHFVSRPFTNLGLKPNQTKEFRKKKKKGAERLPPQSSTTGKGKNGLV